MRWLYWWLGVFTLGAICFLLVDNLYTVKYETVTYTKQIEQAVQVRALENKFIHVERVMLGGAGAGGQGAPQVEVYDANQFVELVAPKERIYTAVELAKTGRRVRGIKQVYWAFIENRPGIVVYERYYYRNGWGVERYDDSSVTFRHESWDTLLLFFLPVLIMGILILFFWAIGLVADEDW